MVENIEHNQYIRLIQQIKERVQLAQKRAIFSASGEMLRMYWDIGKMLSEKQADAGWGSKFLERVSDDMKNEFPEIKGFSSRNCRYMIQFYSEYNQELTFLKQPVSLLKNEILKRPVSQLSTQKFILPITHLSWAHNVILMQRVKDWAVCQPLRK